MINLTLSSDELLLLLGVKEAQIYQHCIAKDKLGEELIRINTELNVATQRNSELLKDRDMDALQIRDLQGKLAQVKMLAGV